MLDSCLFLLLNNSTIAVHIGSQKRCFDEYAIQIIVQMSESISD